ncbi:MAG: amidohydrolase family protein [Saprospiraceae bacterium]|nr:amidohydrolase family protein [Saprospiraceae bacterium]
MKKIFSDFLFDGHQMRAKGAIILDEDGKILQLLDETEYRPQEFEHFPGLICPGFVNAHGHLELSHLRGRLSTGTGLLSFLRSVVTMRDVDPSFIDECIVRADREMWEEGIVAAGDISNKPDTIRTKETSKIKYHTFVEAFDLWQSSMADHFFNTYKTVYDQYGDLPKSMSPHAPYSVSPQLFQKINSLNRNNDILSIHNQEVQDEDLMFLNRGGGFIEFIQNFGFSMDHFIPIGKTSIHYTMDHLKHPGKLLLVHNTMMNTEDISSVLFWNPYSYFVTCPNANLYIENRLPDYHKFTKLNAKICIGTDSLSSNWRLSILEEIKTILKYQSDISAEQTLQWATLNGAEALGMNDWAGSFESGKIPGVLWIQNFAQLDGKFVLDRSAKVLRLF